MEKRAVGAREGSVVTGGMVRGGVDAQMCAVLMWGWMFG